ncbi:MAG: RagB/SusD family nutrient uptake outer membrane protein [Gemmatimonadales bacterium]
MTMIGLKRMLYLAPVAMGMALGGCNTLTTPDFNNPGLGEIENNPNRANIAAQATGLLIGARNGIAGRAGYVSELGILGRESYNFDAADPRFVTELLRDPLNGGNGAFGGNHWVARYINIRNANGLLASVDAAEAEGGVFTSEELAALRGFAKTMQALDLLLVINTRDDLGAPVDVAGDPTGDPAPIVSKTEVFNRIVTLLDDANGELSNGGSSFPFPLSSGFSGFDTPATFQQFNRALKTRVDVYMGNFAQALTDITGSFIDDNPSIDVSGLKVGVYHSYSQGSGDVSNGIFDPSNLLILAHPSIVTDAQPGDERLDRKVIQVPTVNDQAGEGVSSDRAFTIYTSLSAPVPIIRNEELILLRAEANIGMGGAAADAALADINLIRQQSGGLPAITLANWQVMTGSQKLDELLYNKRYSLLFEGHRWIDMRRYGRLSQLPLDVPSFVVHDKFPFPQRECDARTPPPSAGCS